MRNIFLLLICFLIALVLDVAWLIIFGGKIYKNYLNHITRKVNGVPTPILSLLVVCYLLLAIGIVYLVVPKAGGDLGAAFFWGGMLGCIVTGIYSLTNLATIQNWPAIITIMDIIMSVIVSGLTATIVTWIAINWSP